MTLSLTFIAAIAFAVCLSLVKADLPVHCLIDEVAGVWEFTRDDAGLTSDSIVGKCDFHDQVSASSSVTVQLSEPNQAKDVNTGETGEFTLIYDQGMEVTIGGKKYFAFFDYSETADDVYSYCNRTLTGSYHDASGPSNWGCFSGKQKKNLNGASTTVKYQKHDSLAHEMANKVFHNDPQYIKALNKAQKTWVAGEVSHFEGKTLDEIFKISGSYNRVNQFKRKRIGAYMQRQHANRKYSAIDEYNVANRLPETVDWRNVSGKSYVTDVRDQGACGSCFIFGSVEQYADRVKVQSKGAIDMPLSAQQVLDCSLQSPQYAQGCDGGFPYLVAKWAHDFGGVTQEKNYPYKARDGKCHSYSSQKPNVKVHDFNYVGGYYGATNEANMMKELAENGPFTIGIMVYSDFMHYRGGVYTHTKTHLDSAWEPINHAVEAVGFSIDKKTGQKYWIIKNSWSESWGMNGYAYIERGTDCIGIESCSVAADVSFN